MKSKKLNKPDLLMAANAYADFMDIILPGWKQNEQFVDTPMRVAKSMINELFQGMYEGEPAIKTFPNEGYEGMVFSGGIEIKSMCGHHHLPISGKAFVAYIPGTTEDSRVLGLSKLNRIVAHYARRPQIQEGLTRDIFNHITQVCAGNRGVAVMIKAKHFCTCHRGVNQNSDMITSEVSGYFFKNNVGSKDEFLKFIELSENGK